jgi:hypothetical protein
MRSGSLLIGSHSPAYRTCSRRRFVLMSGFDIYLVKLLPKMMLGNQSTRKAGTDQSLSRGCENRVLIHIGVRIFLKFFGNTSWYRIWCSKGKKRKCLSRLVYNTGRRASNKTGEKGAFLSQKALVRRETGDCMTIPSKPAKAGLRGHDQQRPGEACLNKSSLRTALAAKTNR